MSTTAALDLIHVAKRQFANSFPTQLLHAAFTGQGCSDKLTLLCQFVLMWLQAALCWPGIWLIPMDYPHCDFTEEVPLLAEQLLATCQRRSQQNLTNPTSLIEQLYRDWLGILDQAYARCWSSPLSVQAMVPCDYHPL